jgi:hypothetical protein
VSSIGSAEVELDEDELDELSEPEFLFFPNANTEDTSRTEIAKTAIKAMLISLVKLFMRPFFCLRFIDNVQIATAVP